MNNRLSFSYSHQNNEPALRSRCPARDAAVVVTYGQRSARETVTIFFHPAGQNNDSRVSDVNSGEHLVEVLGRQVVEAAAVRQELVELLDRNVAARSRRRRLLLLLLRRAQVFLHGSV